MKRPRIPRKLLRRLEALALAAGTLWAVTVTAGSDTAASALRALWESLPISALRWELGDLWPRDGLSPAAVLTIGESPLLLAARPAVAELWTQTEPEAPVEQEDEEFVTVPVEETPLDAADSVDNGVAAKTLIPTDPSGYTVCGRTYISNSTDYPLSVSDLQQPFAAHLSEDGPQILILHTHGSEAYTPAGDETIVWSGDHRTTDTRCNVVRVGDEMAEVFGQAGISVLHDRTLYDYPSYAGSYDRSLVAIQNYLKQYPSIRFILDVHRDAIEDGQGNQYKVVSAIDGEGTAAQLSIVVGSDGSGLTHPNWIENLRLAVAIQENILAKYPTLMRPVLLRNSRYNQHATAGSLLVEVGSAGNSPEEAVLAGRLFAERMAEVLNAQTN
ncbi:stage II sporulation protein P [Oscillibacter valericigenes]|uniref:stage II sporulation protein P n=1 Tax=Oscillibacter valericigenes TaxID=351091 RepID=UPI001F2E2D2B|nr:stage II sporulation protein P [Oscillibacter valericigenes]MCF2618074.1 stage II sporulation protein P [Oscillibacter valericigenes]MDY6097363.1 stage II sporulation protein P [Oscillospiraceae bacterium]